MIATPDALAARPMIDTARTLSPEIQVAVRPHNKEEAQRLRTEGAGQVYLGEAELADAMVRHVMAGRGA